jgi:hypothetical protein
MPTVPDIKRPRCSKTDDGRIIMSVDNVSSLDVIDSIIFSITINNVTSTNVVIVNSVNSGRIESVFNVYVDDNNIIDWSIISNTESNSFSSVRGYNIFVDCSIADTVIVVGGSSKKRLGVIFSEKFNKVVKVYDTSGNAIILEDIIDDVEKTESCKNNAISLEAIDNGIIHTDDIRRSSEFTNDVNESAILTEDLSDGIAVIHVRCNDDDAILTHTIQDTDDVILTDNSIEVKGIITSSKY